MVSGKLNENLNSNNKSVKSGENRHKKHKTIRKNRPKTRRGGNNEDISVIGPGPL
jgi:hypothetical protein